MAFAPGRRTPVVGALVPLFIILGGITSGGLADALSENAGSTVGVVIQLPALIIAIVSGALATIADGDRAANAVGHQHRAGRP